MDKMQIVVLVDKTILLSEIEEIVSDIGEPNCKLVNPYVLVDSDLIPWLSEYTNQNIFMIHSDKILTIVNPNGKMISVYEKIVKK
jgi:hypothetical protein